MQRIEAFLKEDEVPDWASSLKSKTTKGKPLPPTPSQFSQRGRGSPGPGKDETRVGFEKGIFTWNMVPRGRQYTPFKLGPLNLNFPTGKLSLVSGATGSGKTALLLSLLGGEFSRGLSGCGAFLRFTILEMGCLDGKVLLDKSGGKVAYCAQTPCKSSLFPDIGETD
jgi:hypothetical protein